MKAAVAVPVLAAAVLAVEIELARRGPSVPGPPEGIDACLGCAEAPHMAPLRMVWMGDSTAAGVGASSAGGTLPHQVASRLGRPVSLTVLARSGARIEDVVREQLPKVASLRPEVLVVSVGANDAVHLTGAESYSDRWHQLVPPADAVLVALGIPDMGSPPRLPQPLRALVGWRARRLNRSGAPRMASDGLATYVDIAGRTGPAFRRDPDRYFAADRYHPSDAGYRLWADAVLENLG